MKALTLFIINCTFLGTSVLSQENSKAYQENCFQLKIEIDSLLERLDSSISLFEHEEEKKPLKSVKKSRKKLEQKFQKLIETTEVLKVISESNKEKLLEALTTSYDWFEEIFLYLEESETSRDSESFQEGIHSARARIKRSRSALEHYLFE